MSLHKLFKWITYITTKLKKQKYIKEKMEVITNKGGKLFALYKLPRREIKEQGKYMIIGER